MTSFSMKAQVAIVCVWFVTFGLAQTPRGNVKSAALPEVQALLGGFPELFAVASIPSDDIEGQRLFKSIKSSNTNNPAFQISIKSPGNDSSQDGIPYDNQGDPDCWWSATLCTTPKAKGLENDISTCNQPSTWGLTFDDGPSPDHDVFYDFLQSKRQTATMFYIGSNVLTFPLNAQRGLTDGHELCGHSWSHPSMTNLTDEQVFAELYYTMKAIKQLVGVTIKCWRPPFGDVDDRVRAWASALGLTTVLWIEDTEDFKLNINESALVLENYNKILNDHRKNGNGTIVLTHEISNETMNFFTAHYDNITNVFKHVMPVASCANLTSIYGEGNYTYPNFDEYVSGKHFLVNQTSVITNSLPVLSGSEGTGSGKCNSRSGKEDTSSADGTSTDTESSSDPATSGSTGTQSSIETGELGSLTSNTTEAPSASSSNQNSSAPTDSTQSQSQKSIIKGNTSSSLSMQQAQWSMESVSTVAVLIVAIVSLA